MQSMRRAFEVDPVARSTVQDLIEHEIATRGLDVCRSDTKSGTVGSLWAMR
jgi:hypothetical protein